MTSLPLLLHTIPLSALPDKIRPMAAHPLSCEKSQPENPQIIPGDPLAISILTQLVSNNILDENYQIKKEILIHMPYLDPSRTQWIDRLLSKSFEFHLKLPDQTLPFTLSFTLKEFLQELVEGCKKLNSNIAIIGGAVPWILGPAYCLQLLESLLPGCTACLTEEDLSHLFHLPNDIDIRFRIPPEAKEYINYLKQLMVSYLANKLPSRYSRREREDVITSKVVFEEFWGTYLWNQTTQQADVDYFIFGMRDISAEAQVMPARYDVSLVRLLKRPYLFSMQNLCLDILEFLTKDSGEIRIRPESLSNPQDHREAAQAILEKTLRIFHIPNAADVDQKGWINYASLLVKGYCCPEKSSLGLLRKSTLTHCWNASKDPGKKANTPMGFLSGLLDSILQKHHHSGAEEAIALAFAVCTTAEEDMTQNERFLLWKDLMEKVARRSSESQGPLSIFSQAMLNQVFAFEELSAIVELQAFFSLCSPWAVRSSPFHIDLLTNNGKPCLRLTYQKHCLLLPFQPINAVQLLQKTFAELTDPKAVEQLEAVWNAFSLPLDFSRETIPTAIYQKERLSIPYKDLELAALQLIDEEAAFARKVGYRLYLSLQMTVPESRRTSLLIRQLPAILALEENPLLRKEKLQCISKALLNPLQTSFFSPFHAALEPVQALITDPGVEEKDILRTWTLSLAESHSQAACSEAFLIWKTYQSSRNGQEDLLTEHLFQEFLLGNILLAGELLAQASHLPLEKRIGPYFSFHAACIQQNIGSGTLAAEILTRLTLELFSNISVDTDKDRLAKVITERLENALACKQLGDVQKLLAIEEKKRLLNAREAADFWARFCLAVSKDPSQGIAVAYERYQEAANQGIWLAHKPFGLVLVIIKNLYRQNDPSFWHQADGLVEELYSDPGSPEGIKKQAVRTMITRKNRLSLRDSPLYSKIEKFFHPAERLDFLRNVLQESLEQKNIPNLIVNLKEMLLIHPLPETFASDLVEVCHIMERSNTQVTDNKEYREILEVIFHPLALKALARTEIFPSNFAVGLCHALQQAGEDVSEAIITDLFLLCRQASKNTLFSSKRLLLAGLLSKAVCSTNPQISNTLFSCAEQVLNYLHLGGYFEELCILIAGRKEPIEGTEYFYEKLLWALDKSLNSRISPASVVRACTLFKIYSLGNKRFSASFEKLKAKMMDALLHHDLFAESVEWLNRLEKEAFFSTHSFETALEWIRKLVSGQQYEAAGTILKDIHKTMNYSTDACVCFWVSLPDAMVHRHYANAAKCCMQTSKQVAEESASLASRILSGLLSGQPPNLSVETALALLERYAVPHPLIWQVVFAKAEALEGKDSKPKQKLLPLLTKVAEPAGFLSNNPDARHTCWLSALRTFSPAYHETPGRAWEEILYDSDAFLQVFPAKKPEAVGEAFSLLLEVWNASLERPCQVSGLYTPITATLDRLNDILTRTPGDLFKQKATMQKILLQMIRGGADTANLHVFFQTCELFESLISQICSMMKVEFFKNRDQEVAKALKKLLSSAHFLWRQSGEELALITERLSVIVNRLEGLISEDVLLEIFEHFLSMDVLQTVYEYKGYDLSRQIMKFVTEKFSSPQQAFQDASQKSLRFSNQLSKVCYSLIKHMQCIYEMTIQAQKAFPIELFLQYTRFCRSQAFLQLLQETQQQKSLKMIVEMICLHSIDPNTIQQLIDYINNDFPYFQTELITQSAFVSCAFYTFLNDFRRTNDNTAFCQRIDLFVQNYSSPNLLIPYKGNELSRQLTRLVGEFKKNIFCEILMASVDFMKFLLTESSQDYSKKIECLATPSWEEGVDSSFPAFLLTASPINTADSKILSAYENIIHYLCTKAIQTVDSFLDHPELHHQIPEMIKSLQGSPLILHSKHQTEYFRAIYEIFKKFQNTKTFALAEELFMEYALLFGYVRADLPPKLTPLLQKKIINIMEWADWSSASLCVYRALRILELNQNGLLKDHSLKSFESLVLLYDKAQSLVMKTPFYQVFAEDQEDPDRVAGLPKPPQNSSVTLVQTLIRSFLKLPIQHFLPQGKSYAHFYEKIWQNLFQMLMDIIKKSLEFPDEQYAQSVQLLRGLLKERHRKNLAELDFADLEFVGREGNKAFCLHAQSTKQDYLDSIAYLSAIIEIINIPKLIRDEGEDGFIPLSQRAKSILELARKSSLRSFLSFSALCDFISWTMVPSYIMRQLATLIDNTGCTQAEKLDVFFQMHKSVILPMLNFKTAWDPFIPKACFWYFDAFCACSQEFTDSRIHMANFIRQCRIFLKNLEGKGVFSLRDRRYVESLVKIITTISQSIKNGNDNLNELLAIPDLICLPMSKREGTEPDKLQDRSKVELAVKIELINLWIVRILEVDSIDMLKVAYQLINVYKNDFYDNKTLLKKIEARLEDLQAKIVSNSSQGNIESKEESPSIRRLANTC